MATMQFKQNIFLILIFFGCTSISNIDRIPASRSTCLEKSKILSRNVAANKTLIRNVVDNKTLEDYVKNKATLQHKVKRLNLLLQNKHGLNSREAKKIISEVLETRSQSIRRSELLLEFYYRYFQKRASIQNNELKLAIRFLGHFQKEFRGRSINDAFEAIFDEALWVRISRFYGISSTKQKIYFFSILFRNNPQNNTNIRQFILNYLDALDVKHKIRLERLQDKIEFSSHYNSRMERQLNNYQNSNDLVLDLDIAIESYLKIFPNIDENYFLPYLNRLKEKLQNEELGMVLESYDVDYNKDTIGKLINNTLKNKTSRKVAKQMARERRLEYRRKLKNIFPTIWNDIKTCNTKRCMDINIAQRLKKSFPCLGNNFGHRKDFFIGLGFFSAIFSLTEGIGLTGRALRNEDLALEEIPYEVLANVMLWATIASERGCKAYFMPATPFGFRVNRLKEGITPKVFLRKLLAISPVIAGGATTYTLFQYLLDHSLDREDKLDLQGAFIEWPFKFLYGGVWAPTKSILLVEHIKFKAIPALSAWLARNQTAQKLPIFLRSDSALNILIDKFGIGYLNMLEFKLVYESLVPSAKDLILTWLSQNEDKSDLSIQQLDQLEDVVQKTQVSLEALNLDPSSIQVLINENDKIEIILSERK